jgi:hypothetical protein
VVKDQNGTCENGVVISFIGTEILSFIKRFDDLFISKRQKLI